MIRNNDPRHVSLQRLKDLLLEANVLANEKDANGKLLYRDSNNPCSFQSHLYEALHWVEHFENGGK